MSGKCTACWGSGKCLDCEGLGYYELDGALTTCAACDGTKSCHECDGGNGYAHDSPKDAEISRLREALKTIERSGAPGAAILARRADDHACCWCRGVYTPCPVAVARKALAGGES